MKLSFRTLEIEQSLLAGVNQFIERINERIENEFWMTTPTTNDDLI